MNTILNIEELKGFLTHIITNNRSLQIKGKVPIAVAVEGESGIGKTSSLIQLCDELELDLVKINLAQIEELGDLVGFPIRQFEMLKPADLIEEAEVSEFVWVDEPVIAEFTAMGYKSTGQNRMDYCAPSWIANKKKGVLLLLDDYNRADQRFMQATMELIDRQQYISWGLPPDSHIILTNNPDNGDYSVTSIDNAQKTRFIRTKVKFDTEVWARWAEKEQIDSRCINFLLLHPELVKGEINARCIVTFFNSISSIQSFESSLPLIQMIGEGTVGPEFSTLFVMFINNKLDKLPSPKEILFEGSDEGTVSKLKSVIGVDKKYRADIASTIATRMTNYLVAYVESNTVSKDLIGRLGNIINEDVFTNDLKYTTVRKIYNSNIPKFSLLPKNEKLVKYLLSV